MCIYLQIELMQNRLTICYVYVYIVDDIVSSSNSISSFGAQTEAGTSACYVEHREVYQQNVFNQNFPKNFISIEDETWAKFPFTFSSSLTF